MENKTTARGYFAIIPASVRYDKDLIPSAKLLYGEITALCNEKGYCWAGDKYFAELYGVSKTTVQNWIRSLVDKNYISKEIVYKEGSKEILHRYIRIFAYPTQENLHTPIQENLRDNNTSFNNTFNNTKNKNNRSSTQALKERFESIWKVYPNKKGKDKAFKSYQKAIKEGVTDEEILQGINAYNAEIAFKRTEKQYIAHGATWFGNKRWNDEYEVGTQHTMPDYSVPEGFENQFDDLDNSRTIDTDSLL